VKECVRMKIGPAKEDGKRGRGPGFGKVGKQKKGGQERMNPQNGHRARMGTQVNHRRTLPEGPENKNLVGVLKRERGGG